MDLFLEETLWHHCSLKSDISCFGFKKKIPKHDSLKSSTGLKGKVFRKRWNRKNKVCVAGAAFPVPFEKIGKKNFFHLKKNWNFFPDRRFRFDRFFLHFLRSTVEKFFWCRNEATSSFFSFFLSLSLSFSSSWLDLSFDGICQKDKRSQLNGA